MAAGAGKVALVNSTTPLGCNGGSTPCPIAALASIVDLVGYGTGTSGANFFEGLGPAPTISAILADFRGNGGCTETDNNASDFTAATPAPRNTATALHPCGAVTPSLSINDVSLAEGDSGTTAFDFTVSLSAIAGPGGVTFDIATSDGTATVADNDYTARSLTGQTIPAGSSSYHLQRGRHGRRRRRSRTRPSSSTSRTSAARPCRTARARARSTTTTPTSARSRTPRSTRSRAAASRRRDPGNVTTQGVVVGDFQGTAAMSGFFLQDAAGDGNAATSDGIFVFTGANDNGLAAGDVVRVTGFARERFPNAAAA